MHKALQNVEIEVF